MEQFVLRIVSGPAAGGNIVVPRGKTLRVGRGASAEISIPEDRFLSGNHFSVSSDGRDCLLKDLGSANGTYVNGARVSEAVLQPSDEVAAGWSRFRVAVEAEALAPPVRAPEAPVLENALSPGGAALAVGLTVAAAGGAAVLVAPKPLELDFEMTPLGQSVLEHLRTQPAPVFALLDAARDDGILPLLRRYREPFRNLYDGESAARLENFAPYLVSVSKDSKLLAELVHQGWGKSWGVYLTCDLGLPEVRKHLRHFLIVDGGEDKKLYFRFYDPRVLRSFLPGFTAEEAARFFGPIRSYVLEDEDPQSLIRCLPAPGAAAKVEKLTLARPQPPGAERR